MAEESIFQSQIKAGFIDEDREIAEQALLPPIPSSQAKDIAPLPTQLPQPLDLTQFSENVKKSGAVNLLIQQNEDLMARLTVAIRRHSLMEEKLGKLESTLQQLSDRNEILSDQLLIYKEKDQSQTNSRKTYEKQVRELKEQVSLLEIRYAEYFASSREKIEKLVTEGDQLHLQLNRHIKYRNKMRGLARKRKLELQASIKWLKCENENLEKQLQEGSLLVGDLRARLSETVAHIQRQSSEHEANQRQLVENYESQFLELRNQLRDDKDKIMDMEARLLDQEALFQAKVGLENQLVAQERSYAEIKANFEEQLSSLQKEHAEYRREAKQKHLETGQLREEVEAYRNEKVSLTERNKVLEDQVESIQYLWRDTHQKLETQMEKHEALQRLNQQLSTGLNEQRRELATLKEQRDTSQLQANRKI
ncbi:MAG: hypothetical protein KDD35_06480, partial [Bdellovibrionales bacterium]|nr:hypothetical protein [Bdellovibrionales bacterium]